VGLAQVPQQPVLQAPVSDPDTLAQVRDDTLAPAAVPEVGGGETGLQSNATPSAEGATVAPAAQNAAPVVASGQTQGLTTPTVEPELSISTDPAQPLAPEPVQQTAFAADPVQPEMPAALAEEAVEPVAETPQAPEPVTAEAPTVSADPAQPVVPSVPTETAAFETGTPAPEAQPDPDVRTEAVTVASAGEAGNGLAPELSDAPVVAQIEAPSAPAPAAVPDTGAEAGPAVVPPETAPATEAAPVKPVTQAGEDPAALPDLLAEASQPATQAPPVRKITEDAAVSEPETGAQPVDSTGILAGTLGDLAPEVRTNRLPTLVAPSGTEEAQTDVPDVSEILTPQSALPVERFSVAMENPEGKPMMAIVLMDEGVDLSAGTIGLPALRSFPYPVSFAVDAMLPDATERMAAYRAEGFEVLAMVNLPDGAQASDAEVSLSVAFKAVPEAVGLLEGTGNGVQTTRDAANQVADILQQEGYGFVTQNRGLNTVQKLAAKAGVPSAVVFRDFDGANQTPTVIRRFLDQAAFRAGQEGGVVMLGRLRDETISALLIWGLQDRAAKVAMVPVSGILKTQ
jgi:polysaccharide deacetylase 2 family uncharacterized protein YibQ